MDQTVSLKIKDYIFIFFIPDEKELPSYNHRYLVKDG